MTTRTHQVAAFLVLALTAIWAGDVLGGHSSYFGDESPWITSGEITLRLIEQHAPPSAWERSYGEAGLKDWGVMNPPLAKLYFGVILRLAGVHDTTTYSWDYEKGVDDNRALGNVPPMEWVTPVRLGVVALAGLCLWLIYWCAWQVSQHWTAVLAPLVAFSSLSYFATHVFADVPELALILLGGWCLLKYVERPSPGALAATATIAGLACAVKFSAGQSVVALVLVTLWAPTTWRARLRHTAIALLLPFLVFVAVNPFLYPAPVLRTIALMFAWHADKVFQQHMPAFATVAVWSRLHALDLVINRAILPDVVLLPNAIRWVALSAVVVLALRHFREVATERPRHVAAWAILAGSSFLLTVLWLPLDWPQYYLATLVWMAPLSVAAARLPFGASCRQRETSRAVPE